ncbi:MAG: peptidylprolyl isomerase [Oscillospiraceae bacterium]|nr:peptidylprolyl isomerase [Oscillospiraceae bacterium]
MSASREKQTRQEQASAGWIDPKTVREAQQRKQERRSNILYGVIGIVFAVAVVATIVWRSNIIPKMSTAATIDGEKYTAAEVNFHYQTVYQNTVNNLYSYGMLSYSGLDTTSSLKEQTVSSMGAMMTGATEGETWHDFFLEQALEQMAAVQAALKAAKEEGFTYPAGVQAQYDDSIASLEAAAKASNLSVSQYLKNSFGASMSKGVYEAQFLRLLQYDAYTSAYEDGLTYSDSEITAAYDADPNSYDKAAYEYVTISGAAESTQDDEGNTVEPTEEESAAKEAAKAAADQILAGFQAGGKLETLAGDNSYSNVEAGTYSSSTLGDWVFDSARKAGDSAVLESGSDYLVAVFHDRFREEYNTVDVRHILVSLGTATLFEGDEGYEEEQAQLKADAKAKADELLAQWQSGDATEESFAALAMQESADGSKYDGGLYTQIYNGWAVEAFNDWCFDASRKPGDTAVVETEYGAHVMYFVGEDLPRWQAQVVSDLKSADYNEWAESLPADSTITRSDFGMKFVG